MLKDSSIELYWFKIACPYGIRSLVFFRHLNMFCTFHHMELSSTLKFLERRTLIFKYIKTILSINSIRIDLKKYTLFKIGIPR